MSPINVDDVQREILARLLDARLLRTISVAAPAVGADPPTVTVPGGVVWDFRTWFGLLTTSAVVANRFPRLGFTDGTSIFCQLAVQTTLPASVNGRVTFAVELGGTVTGTINGQGCPLPPLVLPAGYQIVPATTGLDAGDQWSLVCFSVIEYSAAQIEMQSDWINDAVLDHLGSGGLG